VVAYSPLIVVVFNLSYVVAFASDCAMSKVNEGRVRTWCSLKQDCISPPAKAWRNL